MKDEEPRNERAYRQAGTLGEIIAMILFLCFIFIRSTRADLWIGLVVWVAMALLLLARQRAYRSGDLRRPSRRT
jgi:hypothetical protein